MSQQKLFPYITAITILPALIVIVLGAYARSSNAALVCPDLPACLGQWLPQMDFKEGFVPWRGLGVDYEFRVLDTVARTAIHISHRIGVLITLFIVGMVALACARAHDQRLRKTVIAVAIILLMQFGPGLAVAHNGVAPLPLVSLGTLLFFMKNPNAVRGLG